VLAVDMATGKGGVIVGFDASLKGAHAIKRAERNNHRPLSSQCAHVRRLLGSISPTRSGFSAASVWLSSRSIKPRVARDVSRHDGGKVALLGHSGSPAEA
jgi:hypothetical protein